MGKKSFMHEIGPSIKILARDVRLGAEISVRGSRPISLYNLLTWTADLADAFARGTQQEWLERQGAVFDG